jgi:hypothetical protein
MSQCTTGVADGASGSSTMRAKLRVPAGGSVQASAGERFAPEQENFAGMAASASKAALVRWNPLSDCLAAVWDACASAFRDCEEPKANRTAVTNNARSGYELPRYEMNRDFLCLTFPLIRNYGICYGWGSPTSTNHKSICSLAPAPRLGCDAFWYYTAWRTTVHWYTVTWLDA